MMLSDIATVFYRCWRCDGWFMWIRVDNEPQRRLCDQHRMPPEHETVLSATACIRQLAANAAASTGQGDQ